MPTTAVPVSVRFSTLSLPPKFRLVLIELIQRVDAAAGKLGDDVSAVVDDIGVVVGTAGHIVDTEPAVQEVVAGAADQTSLPATPERLSLPASPLRLLPKLLPEITLFSALPMPLKAPPVSDKFSTANLPGVLRLRLIELGIGSMPSLNLQRPRLRHCQRVYCLRCPPTMTSAPTSTVQRYHCHRSRERYRFQQSR